MTRSSKSFCARELPANDRARGEIMRTRLLVFCLAVATLFGPAAAQTDKLVWDKDVSAVKRVAKPGRKPGPRRRPIMQAPLLTIQYRLIKRAEGGGFSDTSPSTVF